MTVKRKGNLYVRPVNSAPNFVTLRWWRRWWWDDEDDEDDDNDNKENAHGDAVADDYDNETITTTDNDTHFLYRHKYEKDDDNM